MRHVPRDHLLRIMVSVLILVATMLLGVGERSAVLSVISLVAVVVSIVVTDVRKSFYLGRATADWVALGIVAVAAANAFSIDRHGQMLAVANLQSYLQYVLLFQPKTSRSYWQLAMLSLGQMAIASTLVPGPLFGVGLLLYLLAGVVTFALLLLSNESARFDLRVAGVPQARPADGSAAASGPLGRQPPALYGNCAASSRGVGWGLLRQGVSICAVTVAVTAVLFFVLPRWNIQNREVATTEPLRAVGFSKKVTLAELGEIVNNPDLVMRIRFFRGLGTRPFKLAGEPLFRGTVVTQYEDGEWTQGYPSGLIALPSASQTSYVRQQIEVEPLDVAELFCVVPVFALKNDPKLRIDTSCEQLARQEDFRSQRIEFEVATTGIVGNKQRTYLPCSSPPGRRALGHLLQMPQGPDSQEDPLPGLRETAARVLREKNVDPSDRVAAAHVLNDHLRLSGRYFYSLNSQPRDRALDPLEDFVVRHPLGHCEYFAGSLVMMLRSQDIPARMAIGFKGGEWNPLGMYYQVQQLHAHAWVEVYLGPEDVPPDELSPDDPQGGGAWLVLDPTEGSTDAGQAGQDRGILARLRQSLDYGRVLWSNYVVGLNSKRQQQGIYQPLSEGVSAAVDNLVSAQVWQARFHAVANSPVGTFWDWYRRHWFSWRGGLVAAGFSLVVAFGYFAVGWLLRALRKLGLVGTARASSEPPVLEMYRRLEAALAQHGFARRPAQTAYEFAHAAGGNLAESIEHRRVAHLPRRIVELFYRVRFGGRTLDNSEALAVEHALVELERALARRR